MSSKRYKLASAQSGQSLRLGVPLVFEFSNVYSDGKPRLWSDCAEPKTGFKINCTHNHANFNFILIYLTAKETHIIQYPFNTRNRNHNLP